MDEPTRAKPLLRADDLAKLTAEQLAELQLTMARTIELLEEQSVQASVSATGKSQGMTVAELEAQRADRACELFLIEEALEAKLSRGGGGGTLPPLGDTPSDPHERLRRAVWAYLGATGNLPSDDGAAHVTVRNYITLNGWDRNPLASAAQLEVEASFGGGRADAPGIWHPAPTGLRAPEGVACKPQDDERLRRVVRDHLRATYDLTTIITFNMVEQYIATHIGQRDAATFARELEEQMQASER